MKNQMIESEVARKMHGGGSTKVNAVREGRWK